MQQVTINSLNLTFRTQESYKTLRSNIEFSGNEMRVISMTSCAPNEGKSQASFELARSFAENGNSVILIDADLRKSVMHEHFRGGRVKYGLSNYLVGQCEPDDATCETVEPGFYMMFSGPNTPTPSELLNSQRFADLLTFCRKMYDYTIVDCPPIGSVIDGAIVGKQCDGTILVIAAGEISYHFAQDMKNQLDRAGCHLIGCVLNKVPMENGKGYYGKYYGRYYGKYYGKYYGDYYGNDSSKQ